jgi:hypothetical protein
MSDSHAPDEFVAKRRMSMRVALLAAMLPTLVACSVANAQVSGMVSPTPSIGATSPLGLTTGSTVSPTGIPLGSTEIASPGVSPAPVVTGTISMPSSGTSCSTLGTSPSGMFGSTATYDGGGVALGTTAPATAATSAMPTSSGMSATSGMLTTSGMVETSGLSGMCGSGSNSIAASSTPTSTSPTTPGGAARTGLPLGSTEIGNLGVSSGAVVPTPGVSPTIGSAAAVPTVPAVTPPPTASATVTNLFPCLTPGAAGASNTTDGC